MSNIYFYTLCKIVLSHEYHADETCNELEIIPTHSTRNMLNRFGILFKKTNSGAILLYESPDGTSTMKIPIENELKLTFQFSASNPAFINYTDSDFSAETLTFYYFNNLAPTIDGNNHIIVNSRLSAPLKLENKYLRINKINASSKYVIITSLENKNFRFPFDNAFNELKIDLSNFNYGKYSIQQYDQTHNKLGEPYPYFYSNEITSSRLFGIFELFIDENYNLLNPVSFHFNFKSRPTFWMYKILKKPSTPPLTIDNINASTLTIHHEPENPADELLFGAASGSDPIVIRSQSAIKLKEKGYDKIRLKKNNEILISNLPNASSEKLEKDGVDWLSDIYVYVYV